MLEWQAVMDQDGWTVVSERGIVLARVMGRTEVEAELNARLMASAPVLREIIHRQAVPT